ncbi:MAG: hypothetical protein U0T36_07495 [Saprospiraceae bacterium]
MEVQPNGYTSERPGMRHQIHDGADGTTPNDITIPVTVDNWHEVRTINDNNFVMLLQE